MSPCANIRFVASAGTGKTHQVVQLYLALLTGRPFPQPAAPVEGLAPGAIFPGGEPVPPEQMLMLTFTRNAAAEMRSRVHEALERELAAAPAGAEAFYWNLLRRLPAAVIDTIHAFAYQVVLRHALRLGLAPTLTVLEEWETQAILDASLEAVLRAGLGADDPQLRGDLEQLAEGLGLEKLRDGIAQTLRKAAAWGLDLRTCDPATLVTQPVPPRRQALEQLYDKLATTPEGANRRIGELAAALRGALSSLSSGATPEAWAAKAGELVELGAGSWGRGPAVKALRSEVMGRLEVLAEYPKQCEAVRLFTAFLRLVRQCAVEVEQRKRARGGVDFDDLLFKARELMRTDPTCVPPVQVIIVDEAQDNSHLQNELLALIRAASGAALIVCGDGKQTIYGWRGADPTGLERLDRVADLRQVSLRTSYRSQKALLEWVNELFREVVFGPQEYGESECLLPCAAASGTVGPNVELLLPDWELRPDPREKVLIPSREEDRRLRLELDRQTLGKLAAAEEDPAGIWAQQQRLAEQAVALEARAVARRIRLLVASEVADAWVPAWSWDSDQQAWVPSERRERRYRFRDILILLRASTRQEIYEQALREEGIPYTTDGKGRGFFYRQEVLDVANLLQWLAWPRDELALVGLLRSPFVALSDSAVSVLARQPGKTAAPRGSVLCELVTEYAARTAAAAQTLQQMGLAEDAAAWKRAAPVLARLRGLAGRVTAVELVREAVRLTGYDAILAGSFHGAQRLANLQKVLTWIRTRERDETLDLQGVAWRLREAVESGQEEPDAAVLDPEDDSVRINTVHAAKGLTSPVVFVPDLRWTELAERDWIHVRRAGDGTADGFTACLSLPEDKEGEAAKLALPDYKSQLELVRAERARESRRLFYVACTRARDLVVLSGENPVRNRADSWRDWLNQYVLRSEALASHVRLVAYSDVQAAWEQMGARGAGTEQALPSAEVLAVAGDWRVERRPRHWRFPATLLARVLEEFAAPLEASPADWTQFLRSQVTGLAPARAAASGAEEQAGRDLALQALEETAEHQQLGGLAHRVLESLDYWSGTPWDQQVSAAPALSELAIGERQPFCQRLTAALRALETLLRGVEETQVLREAPFCARFAGEEGTVLVDGRLDLLVLKDGWWHLGDYKFSDTPAEELRRRYGLQLAIYRAAVTLSTADGLRLRFAPEVAARGLRLLLLRVPSEGPAELLEVSDCGGSDLPARLVQAAHALHRALGGE